MRFYGFGNYYLSSLQQALQAHHVAQEIFNKYIAPSINGSYGISEEGRQFTEWSTEHKTIVLLNGGNSKDLEELKLFFQNEQNTFAHASFMEDWQSLNCALTSVGIILPEYIYETAANDRKFRGEAYPRPALTPFENQLVERLNQYGLAK